MGWMEHSSNELLLSDKKDQTINMGTLDRSEGYYATAKKSGNRKAYIFQFM